MENLEEELQKLESESKSETIGNGVNPLDNQVIDNTQMNNQKIDNMQMSNQVVNNQPNQMANTNTTYNEPAMVNPNVAEGQTNAFNFATLDFNSSQIPEVSNPVSRLVGEKGQMFRLHILPNTPFKVVHIHYHEEFDEVNNRTSGHNFVCLQDVYKDIEGKPHCCVSHGDHKTRIVLPVIVYQTQGNVNQVVPNGTGELKVLILGYKTFKDLREQIAGTTGADINNIDMNSFDLIATVDSVQFKSFNFAINQNVMLNQVGNLKALQDEWKKISTGENIVSACGRLITMEEYQKKYANYDLEAVRKRKNFNTPMQQSNGYNQQSYNNYNQQGNGYNQQSYDNNYNQNYNQYQQQSFNNQNNAQYQQASVGNNANDFWENVD